MEDLIAVFEPNRSGNNILTLVCIVLAVLALGFLVYNQRRTVSPEKRSMAQLFSLLAGFVILIAIGTGIFSFWAGQKSIPVKVSTNAIETLYGKTNLDDINQLYIHYDQKLSPISGKLQGDSTRLLMIIENDGKTHVLSEENYPIDSIAKVLRKLE